MDNNYIIYIRKMVSQILNSPTMMGPKKEPIMAHNVMVTELIEKVSSLYSAAFAVPKACEALPRAIPLPWRLQLCKIQ
jgi:hypothetical protein